MKKQNKNPNSSRKEFGDYVLGKTLGEGTFGKVKLATHKHTGQHVAIKILEKSKIQDVADVERVSRQIHILKLIRHPNIVQLYEIIQTPKQLFLIMEFMENGQLFEYIVKKKRIKEEQASKLFHQLIDGVQYIHKIGVSHRDLKPQNLLLDYKKSLRIVDFGLSNTYKTGQRLKTPCGSPCYAAPQMIKGQKYDGLRVDLWSCGVILFAMVCGFLPFEDPETSALYNKILTGKYNFHSTVSDEARDLISKILNNDQCARYTIEEIRNHPWMTKTRSSSYISPGIVIGFNKMPIDQSMIKSLVEYNFESDYVNKCLEANRHNNATTAYYLALKKHVKGGGNTNCDLASKSFDKTLIQPNKRKEVDKSIILMDNFLSKNTDSIVNEKVKRKSSKQRVSRQKFNSVLDMKQLRTSSKSKSKELENSVNYGYCRMALVSKSNEKSVPHRQSFMQNRISRKYKETFNQSLVSKSREKTAVRSRINSSINVPPKSGKRIRENSQCLKDLSNFMEEFEIKGSKQNKKFCAMSIKCDTSKVIKGRRY